MSDDSPDSPIFKSTYQAVQVAYLMAAAPPTVKSMLRTCQEMYAEGQVEKRVNTSGINFGDSDSLEQRAECANIRKIVERTLSGVELDVVLARFAVDYEQTKAVVRMQGHIKASITGVANKAADDIVMRIFCAPRHRDRLSLHNIARNHGVSYRTAKSAFKSAKDIVFSMEQQALSRLSPIFIQGGIAEN